LLDDSKARVIMLIAPAGYGKTTLAREWLTQADRQAAWYLGSAATADVAALAQGVAAAVSRFVPDAGARMRDFLRATRSPEDEPETLALLLSNDLRAWPKRTWLVIDDYHFARESHSSEAFVEALVRLSPIRLLLTTRDRPSWLSARGVLYGEITEIGAALLTMNASEATEALSDRAPDEIAELVALSGGWPAVIGLASLNSDIKAPDVDMPLALYEFFAEEVYSATPPGLREGLERLAYMPRFSLVQAVDLLGANAEEVLRLGRGLGFLAPVDADRMLQLHPLLAIFLRRRLEIDVSRRPFLASLAEALLAANEWDAAFEVAKSLRSFDLLDRLLIDALDAILEESRYPTLERWLRWAIEGGSQSAILDVALGELDIRRGLYASAETFSTRAARALACDHLFASRALVVAGRAAALASNDLAAIDYFESALAVPGTTRTRSDAAWSRFACALELQRPDVEELFAGFRAMRTDSFDDTVRERLGTLALASTLRTLEASTLTTPSVRSVLSRIKDPMVRTSYLNKTIWCLVMLGRYREAVELAKVHLDYVSDTKLEFALPYALLLRASAEAGQRRFRIAETLVTEALEHGRRQCDGFIVTSAIALQARIYLAQGKSSTALDLADGIEHRAPTERLQGELLATRGLALACQRMSESAEPLIGEALSLTDDIEVSCLALCGRAVIGINQGNSTQIDQLAQYSDRTGAVDALVTTYRADPRVLSKLAEKPAWHAMLRSILRRASDARLISEFRLASAADAGSLSLLTKRELEILGLLCDGLTNREIGATLHISQSTAKVHVRNILRKLGVQTRTQAVLRATEI
jgi:LuxR family maltose regulon positive regulatory protein